MKKILTFLLAIMLIVALAACGADTPAPTPEPEAPIAHPTPEPTPVVTEDEDDEDRIFRAAFITYELDESQVFSWREFQRLKSEFGFEMDVFAGEHEPAVEIAGIEYAIAEGFDAIFVNPSNIESVIPALNRAKNAGLIVGMFSSELPEEYRHLRDFWVGSDDFWVGSCAGAFLSEQFPYGATFVEVGGPGGHPAQVRHHDGFRAAIADNIIELGAKNTAAEWNAQEASEIMEGFIEDFGNDIDIVWCHWDKGASGVINALHNAGMYDVFVIGVDGLETGYAQVRTGTQALSVDRRFDLMTWQSLYNARALLLGQSVPEINTISPYMLTFDTIAHTNLHGHLDSYPYVEYFDVPARPRRCC